jgi:nitrate reductase delta subunit
MDMKMVMETDEVRTIAYAVSQLLRYPDKEWEGELQSVHELLLGEAEPLSAEAASLLRGFVQWAEATAEVERLQTYIGLFDFGKKTSLYMTYAAYGEERERGPALLALKQIYEEADLVMDDRELSDYLPLVLEFAAAAFEPLDAARALEAVLPGIGTLHEQLQQAASPYAQLTGAALLAADLLCRTVAAMSSLVAMAKRSHEDAQQTAPAVPPAASSAAPKAAASAAISAAGGR